jgi:signal transduction histidine kinase
MRRRILRLAVATALFALLLFGLPLAVAVRMVYVDDERTELAHLAEQAAAVVSIDSIRGTDPVELPSTERDVTIGIYDVGGRRVRGTGPPAVDATAARALTGQLAEHTGRREFLVAVPVRQGEEVVGLVRVSSSTTSADRRAALTWAAMLGLAALALLAAGLVARRQAGRLTRPLTQLAGAAHALGDGDFSVRSERSGIAEIDTAAVALDTTAARLQALLTRERAFSANASHQLRTPVTGLRLTLEAALAGDGTGLRNAAARAIEATDRLERTIEELLAIARADTADRGVLDIDALLDDLRTERIGVLATQARGMRVERDDALPTVTASPMAVRQILAVLVDNAIEHGVGTVTLRAREAMDALALDISDEGTFPSGSRWTQLFERSDSGRAGLGLTIARALAEAEGGRLVLTSTDGPTTFTLFLSAEPEPAGPTA